MIMSTDNIQLMVFLSPNQTFQINHSLLSLQEDSLASNEYFYSMARLIALQLSVPH